MIPWDQDQQWVTTERRIRCWAFELPIITTVSGPALVTVYLHIEFSAQLQTPDGTVMIARLRTQTNATIIHLCCWNERLARNNKESTIPLTETSSRIPVYVDLLTLTAHTNDSTRNPNIMTLI
jgi:hypothetical protein